MNKAVFITGATGFLGTEMVEKLVETREETIYVLVRVPGTRKEAQKNHTMRQTTREEAAIHRLKAAWYHFLLYRNIGITMSGSVFTQLHISKCYFSVGYSADQCRYMSAMGNPPILTIMALAKKIAKVILS